MINVNNSYFKIDTLNSTYLFKVNPIGMLEHIYYGKKIKNQESYKFLEEDILYGGGVEQNSGEYRVYNDCASFEFSNPHRGDFREGYLKLFDSKGDGEFEFLYENYEIIHNHFIPNLPNSLNKEETLVITLVDKRKKIKLKLFYSTFKDSDVITKSSELINNSSQDFRIDRIMSNQIDFIDRDFDIVTFNGAWAKERQVNENKLGYGITKNASNYGFSSASSNPFVILKSNDAILQNGEVYGFNLIYSGNHVESFERTSYHKVRFLSGINDYSFEWLLKSNSSFFTPEATICYCSEGLNKLTSNYHNFINNHIIPSQFRNKTRPILINNWEATYFNFNEESLLNLAKTAKELGIEMFVLDDGWFGKRNDDSSSLGDWFPNIEKLPNGISGLAKKINNLGLDFGLWVEPEMISENSELYRKHPSWAISNPSYKTLKSRNQYILDLTNKDVRDYLFSCLSKVFKESNASYIKWDCNRNFNEYFSAAFSLQNEFPHRYILGLYDLLGRLTKSFPNILFESCSGGGNRVDLGMLSFMPQYWCSDNSDGFDRMKIQEGTLMCYPQSTLGAHVSSSISHQTLREMTLDNKFNVACIGAFGYELDLSSLSNNDLKVIKEQIKWYKKHRELLQFGEYNLISSVFKTNHYMFNIVSPNKEESIYFLGNKIFEPYSEPVFLKPLGLNNKYIYHIETRKQFLNSKLNKGEYSEVESFVVDGSTLMNSGVRLSYEWISGNGSLRRIMEDFGSRLYYIVKEK